MSTVIAALAIALAGAPGEASGDLDLPTRIAFGEPAERSPKEAVLENMSYLEAALRFTVPGGTVVSGAGLGYGDLFGIGVGGGLQYDYLWRLSPPLLLGAYLEIDFDSYSGSSSTDSFGNTVKPDTMNTFRTLAGVKLREEFGRGARFFTEEYMAVGANVYPSVKGALTSGGVTTTGELFASKTSFAFDLGANLGWDISRQVGLFVGFALEINGGPGQGKDIVFVSSTGSSSPGTMVNFGINLGVNIRF